MGIGSDGCWSDDIDHDEIEITTSILRTRLNLPGPNSLVDGYISFCRPCKDRARPRLHCGMRSPLSIDASRRSLVRHHHDLLSIDPSRPLQLMQNLTRYKHGMHATVCAALLGPRSHTRPTIRRFSDHQRAKMAGAPGDPFVYVIPDLGSARKVQPVPDP